MSEVAIRCEGLGKQYRIGKRERYRTLRDTLTDAMYAPFRRIRSAFQPSSLPASQHPNGDDTIWALKDVSFEIKQGEVVGIIGRNGAGKSTLLKILSRITEPTEGTAEIHGRVGSLLEVGTGFHPELTGRENIYLNGAILGMRKAEIGRNFDEIVAFAEVEQFIDTPVKHYSSGMYMRLAFAVAAHLEPEILLVDEVLAVGDLAFQKKCLGKMSDVAKEGRTVLFVSHNLAAVGRLCTRGIYLAEGRIAYDGLAQSAIGLYVKQLPTAEAALTYRDLSLQVLFEDEHGSRITVWQYNSDLIVQVYVNSREALRDPAIDLAFYSESGVRVFAVQSDRLDEQMIRGLVKQFSLEFAFRNIGIACDLLTVDIGIRANKDPRYLAWWQRIETLAVSLSEAKQYCVPETLVCVPCQVSILDFAR